MNLRLLLVLNLILSCSILFGQQSNDSIIAKKVFGGYTFSQNGEAMTMGDLKDAMQSNTDAYRKIKSARAYNYLSYALSFSGGFLAGYALGAGLGGGEVNWELAGLGAGLIVASVPISNSANRKAKEAVDIYNSGLSKTSFRDGYQLKVALNGNGLGLTLSF